MSEQDNRIAQKLLSISARSGPQVRQSGQRLIIEQGNQTITVELGQTIEQSSSTPRFR